MIRPVRPGDASTLSRLAFRSKAHWGYSDEFMEACREELTYSEEQLRDEQLVGAVAELGLSVTGFYLLVRRSGIEFELDALFVDPDHIGTGIGRALIEHAKRESRRCGVERLSVLSDPNAMAFYLRAGGECVGERESGSVSGRFLPVFHIALLDS